MSPSLLCHTQLGASRHSCLSTHTTHFTEQEIEAQRGHALLKITGEWAAEADIGTQGVCLQSTSSLPTPRPATHKAQTAGESPLEKPMKGHDGYNTQPETDSVGPSRQTLIHPAFYLELSNNVPAFSAGCSWRGCHPAGLVLSPNNYHRMNHGMACFQFSMSCVNTLTPCAGQLKENAQGVAPPTTETEAKVRYIKGGLLTCSLWGARTF